MIVQQLQRAFFLHQQGRLVDAAEAYKQVLKANPRNVDALNLLGQCSFHMGAPLEAVKQLNKCLKIRPDFAPAHQNLGDVLVALGDRKGALSSLRRAVALDPSLADVHGNIGSILNNLEQFEEATASFRRALEINPDLVRVHNDLGLTLFNLARYPEAEACLRRALALAPDYVLAHNNLGNALNALGRSAEAEQCFRRALEIDPRFTLAYLNLAGCVLDNGFVLEAEAYFRKALALDPDLVDANLGLANTLRFQGRYAEAEKLYADFLRINPNGLGAYSSQLFLEGLVEEAYSSHGFERARQFGRMLTKRVEKPLLLATAPSETGRLRVGLVSGDLRNHPVGFFLEGVLEHLDPARIELLAYPTQSNEDALTDRIRSRFSAWKPIFAKNDKDAAETIRADDLHILVDLSGHTVKNRLPLFAWRPAPVQASWLGYFSTTGVAEMDYLIADEVGVPEAQCAYFTEKIWYLPDTRLCYTALTSDVGVEPLPALHNGHITFGCFQNVSKIGDAVLRAWSKVLAAVPGARLRLQSRHFVETAFAESFLARCRQFGIDPSRLSIVGRSPREDYLAAHNSVDLILDTFPYPGGTTTCDALWMGVPTLTLSGATLLARQGASLLTAAGLPDWIVTSEQEYVEKAIALAGDVAKLAALRQALRQQVLASPLFDAPRFARNLEDALWGMWQAKGRANPG